MPRLPHRPVGPDREAAAAAWIVLVLAVWLLARGLDTAAPPRPAPVDLNRASPEVLVAIPGIGPVRAERLAAEREARGGFRDLREVADAVPGVTLETWTALRDAGRITLEPPPDYREDGP